MYYPKKKRSKNNEESDSIFDFIMVILMLVGFGLGWSFCDRVFKKYFCSDETKNTCPPETECPMDNNLSCPTITPCPVVTNSTNQNQICPIGPQCSPIVNCPIPSLCPTPSTCVPMTCPTRTPCSACPVVTPCPTCFNNNAFYNIYAGVPLRCLDLTKTTIDSPTYSYFTNTCDSSNANQKYFLNYFTNDEFQIMNSSKTTCLDAGTSPWSLTSCDNTKTSQRFKWDDSEDQTESDARIKSSSSGNCLDVYQSTMNSACNSSNGKKLKLFGIP